MSRARDLLLLVRAPLAATAAADAIVGWVFGGLASLNVLAHEPYRVPPGREAAFAATIGASCSLYWAGMALNDLFDRERDKALAPRRPIPSGRISVGLAAAIGFGLLGAGIALGALAAGVHGALAAGAVAVAVLLYDAAMKKWRLPGAVAMAACRLTNVLFAATAARGDFALAQPALAHSFLVFLYVFALTLLSTTEDEDAGAGSIVVGFGCALAPVVCYGAVLPSIASWLALGPLALLVAGRLGIAKKQGTRASGKTTTRWLLRGILLLDAGALLGADQPRWALAVLALAVPYLGGARLLMGPPPPK